MRVVVYQYTVQPQAGELKQGPQGKGGEGKNDEDEDEDEKRWAGAGPTYSGLRGRSVKKRTRNEKDDDDDDGKAPYFPLTPSLSLLISPLVPVHSPAPPPLPYRASAPRETPRPRRGC